jgi:putative spermidine/putrescine transport system permease protein
MMTFKTAATGGKGWHEATPALPAFMLLFFFFLAPVAALLLRSLTDPSFGLQNYAEIFATTTYARVISNTFIVAGLVTLVSLMLGYPVAWMLAIMPKHWANLIFSIVILSMWTNLLARTYAWMVLLQRTGVINKTLMNLGVIDQPLQLVNNLVGVTIGMVYIMLPFIILPLHATIRNIDPALLNAASLCGANRWQSFCRVLLPLSMTGAAAGALMVFVMSLGYYVTPSLLGGTANMMLAGMIAQLIQSLLKWGLGSAAAFILLVVTLIIYAVQVRVLEASKSGIGQR